MEGFTIDLKTFLGLAMPYQCSQSKYRAGFGMIIQGQNPLTFMIPIYVVLLYYMILLAHIFNCSSVLMVTEHSLMTQQFMGLPESGYTTVQTLTHLWKNLSKKWKRHFAYLMQYKWELVMVYILSHIKSLCGF